MLLAVLAIVAGAPCIALMVEYAKSNLGEFVCVLAVALAAVLIAKLKLSKIGGKIERIEERGEALRRVTGDPFSRHTVQVSKPELSITPGKHHLRVTIDWCSSGYLDFEIADQQTLSFECGNNVPTFAELIYVIFLRNKYLWLKQT